MFRCCNPWSSSFGANDEEPSSQDLFFCENDDGGSSLVKSRPRLPSTGTMSTDGFDILGSSSVDEEDADVDHERDLSDALAHLRVATDSIASEDALRSLYSALQHMDSKTTSRHCSEVLSVVYDALSRPRSEAPSPLVAAPVLYCFARYNMGFACRQMPGDNSSSSSSIPSVIACKRLQHA